MREVKSATETHWIFAKSFVQKLATVVRGGVNGHAVWHQSLLSVFMENDVRVCV